MRSLNQQNENARQLRQVQFETESHRIQLEDSLRSIEMKLQDGTRELYRWVSRLEKPVEFTRRYPLLSAGAFILAGFVIGTTIEQRHGRMPEKSIN
jgi:hypothetical protein